MRVKASTFSSSARILDHLYLTQQLLLCAHKAAICLLSAICFLIANLYLTISHIGLSSPFFSYGDLMDTHPHSSSWHPLPRKNHPRKISHIKAFHHFPSDILKNSGVHFPDQNHPQYASWTSSADWLAGNLNWFISCSAACMMLLLPMTCICPYLICFKHCSLCK